MPRGFAGETVAQESRGRTSPSRSAVSSGRSSARKASRSPGRGVSAQTGASSAASQQAVREVQQREERARSSMANVPSALTGLMLGLGSAMRSEIIRQIEAGGTPVRENGMVIGVMSNGRYTGRQREADRLANIERNRDDIGEIKTTLAKATEAHANLKEDHDKLEADVRGYVAKWASGISVAFALALEALRRFALGE